MLFKLDRAEVHLVFPTCCDIMILNIPSQIDPEMCHQFLIVCYMVAGLPTHCQYVCSHNSPNRSVFPLSCLSSYYKRAGSSDKKDADVLIDRGISHLATRPLSIGPVNQLERVEDESATGDEPSRRPHRGSSRGERKKENTHNSYLVAAEMIVS